MRSFLIAGLLACTCLQQASALPRAYDEATDGDLAGSFGFAATALVFDVGSNTIKGVFTLLDADHFAFFVPSGLVVASASVTVTDLLGDINGTAWSVFSGTNVLGTGALLGNVDVAPPGSAVLPGLPLGANTYNLFQFFSSHTVSGSSASYTFEFIVESVSAQVPEPMTAAVLSAGLGALGFARRRRRA